MSIKNKKGHTKEQRMKIALDCMNLIAKARDILSEIGYVRNAKNGEPSKKIFSEYVEGLICDMLNLKRAKNINQKGYDAIDPKTKKKFQIKDTTQSAPHIGDKIEFDYLIIVKLNRENFSIRQIAIFPKDIVKKSIGKKKDFRFKKKEHGRFIIYENNRFLKKVPLW